jgi:type IV secretion system protein VirB8
MDGRNEVLVRLQRLKPNPQRRHTMSGVTADSLKEYFERARTFDQQRQQSAERSRRLAWAVAAAASGLAMASVLAVAALAPLKTVEPFVVRVDNASGVVDVVSPLRGSQTYHEAVTKYWCAIYVRAREGYIQGEAAYSFKTASLMSADAEQQRFGAAYSGKNPESPQVVYGRSATAKINIKSIAMHGKQVASVRYSKLVTRGDEVRTTHGVATLTFAYVSAPMAEGDRLINPLGFQVQEYRVDPEAP